MFRTLILAGLTVLAGFALGAEEPLKALIVDGQNNHNWKGTTPLLKKALEASGRFVVDVATSPPPGQPMDSFKPDFSKYAVVVSNYNGAMWPKETCAAFEKYMAGGGGLVSVHAADNSFPGWAEYNKMIGLGGWGGRNEKWGPMVRWRDGKIVRDTEPGAGGTHGANHEYCIDARMPDHPILAGLPEKWKHTSDELYGRLRGPAENLTVLATAFSDKAKGGTGEHEPALFTITYGKGRVFHTILGHDERSVKCVGFVTTLQRGAEWAATGKVTIPKPDNFPGSDNSVVWEPK
jgi:type 1 glutamine amidotransferase